VTNNIYLNSIVPKRDKIIKNDINLPQRGSIIPKESETIMAELTNLLMRNI